MQYHNRIQALRGQLQSIGVTGTNGKSSTTSMLSNITAQRGLGIAEMTTLGARVNDQRILRQDRQEIFWEVVQRAVHAKVPTLCLEVTSQALMNGFAKNWAVDVGVFTNLTLDHMDTHGSAEHYLASKAQLFAHLPLHGCAVLNADDHASDLLREIIPQHCRIQYYSVHSPNTDLQATHIDVQPTGTRMILADSLLSRALGGSLHLQAVGTVFAYNALGAALGAFALGYRPDEIKKGLESWSPISGRFEIVHHNPLVVVDYAHTPDGLQRTLETAAELCSESGRIFCVFGCGGDRDPSKRPQMGLIADEYADKVIVTSDNPRFEDNHQIVEHIMDRLKNLRKWTIEHDRQKAIELALQQAQPQDIVLIAGKGHEETQSIKGQAWYFSDQQVVQEYFATIQESD